MKGMVNTVGNQLVSDYRENTYRESTVYRVLYIVSGMVMGIFIIPAVLIYRGTRALFRFI